MATSSAPQLRVYARIHAASTQDGPSLLRRWHLTSLDAPTVAAVWTLGFAWASRVVLAPWVAPAIALAAWSAYIGDRLLDARSANGPLRPRHLFHWKHRRVFLPLAIAAAVISAALFLSLMPVAARARNSLLAAAALAYFSSVHSPWRLRLRFPKELLVGVLFTLACAAPAWTRSAHRAQLLPAIVCFVALAWLNCHAIESWESASRGSPSVFLPALMATGFAAFGASILAALSIPRMASLLAAAAVSFALLAMLDRLQPRLHPTTLRAAADLVLLAPLGLLAIA